MARQQPLRTGDPSRQVGPYTLLTQIGEGGMGVVHLAQAPDGRRVALKVLRPHIVGDEEARQRLAREVASLQRVRSPRIAEVIDADPWGRLPYVATRYVPGLSLHQHLREEGPILGEDLRLLAQGLAEAVIAVHSVGVLHRDIKPSNILLEGRAPVLIDFGLARLADDPRLTQTGWLLGTPGYLAPEILFGDDATTASDVHSWAATMVFAATGRPPFGTGPSMAIMDRVRRGEHDLSEVPEKLLVLVRDCLATEPRDRPEMAAVLAAVRSTAPVRPDLRGPQGQATMPFSLTARDDDRTETMAPETGAGVRAGAAGAAGAAAARTTPAWGRPRSSSTPSAPPTRALPAEAPAPARAPYQQPPPPRNRTVAGRPGRRSVLAGHGWSASPSAGQRLQQRVLLLGLFAAVAGAAAVVPYLAAVALMLGALAVRAVSWTTEASRERQQLRGRRSWYDAGLTLATAPWYTVVALGGTLILLLWAWVVALVVSAVFLVLQLPVVTALLLIGAATTLSLWWGPGSRRLRTPVRRLAALGTRSSVVGWSLAAALMLVVIGEAYLASVHGVDWSPRPGPPWRPGTLLGSLR